MKIIIITREDYIHDEAKLINRFFDCGLQRLHLRKPSWSLIETADLLQKIDGHHYPKIVLHDNYSLLNKYHLGGVHLNRRNNSFNSEVAITTSTSCHSFSEVIEMKAKYDYLFLSPIFDSISKKGYKTPFLRHDLEHARDEGVIDERVIALGGVTIEKLHDVKTIGFGGAAILGDAWENPKKYCSLLEFGI